MCRKCKNFSINQFIRTFYFALFYTVLVPSPTKGWDHYDVIYQVLCRPFSCQCCSNIFVNLANCHKHKLKVYKEEKEAHEAVYRKNGIKILKIILI